MQDILFELPSYDDDRDDWSKLFVWAYDDGTYSIADEYGDHESLDQEELPSQEGHDKQWREYRLWVRDTGRDPLGDFLGVRHFVKVKERWQFKLAKTLVGPRLIGARHAGRTYDQGQLPAHVKSFLNLDASGKLSDFSCWEELIELLPDIKAGHWFLAHIEQDQPRKESVIARELRSAARKALKNKLKYHLSLVSTGR